MRSASRSCRPSSRSATRRDSSARDPNLAEALPVRDALFVVKGGEARLEPDPVVTLRGGDFADLSKWDWKDDTVVASEGAALVRDPKGRNARIVQKVKVHPFRAYHVAVRVKTQDFRGEPEVKVLAGKRTLSFANLHVAPTQDWKVHHLVFDSLEEDEVSLYLGAWGADTGSLWWDEASIEEAGPVNVVRREGAPFVVRREGGAVLREGADFEPVADPRMGTVPWKGGYEVWHDAPTIHTKLKDGTRLRVSWQYAAIVLDEQVTACLSEPKTVDLLRDQAKRMHAVWRAKGYFMSHDEIRAGGTDDACAKRELSAGAILAENARACVKILKEVNPGGDVYVWSDMFDPAHNARADYYLVKGDLAGSWEGLDRDVIVACWYREKRDESLAFFAKRGHRTLLAGYYDAPSERVAAETREWLDAAKKVEGVVGVMYTTWRRGYADLERFEQAVEAAR